MAMRFLLKPNGVGHSIHNANELSYVSFRIFLSRYGYPEVTTSEVWVLFTDKVLFYLIYNGFHELRLDER
jgi:hypothetical protein